MAQRRFHYDLAFEHYLRDRTMPYIAVDEARRALTSATGHAAPMKLKSFDFVVYSQNGRNLLVDVKGRKHAGRSVKRLDNWVTQGDVDSLERWEKIFGEGFVGAFAFLYWCETPPPDALFQETFECGGRWYAVLGITLADYRAFMRNRSQSWETLSMPAADFARLAQPFRELL